MGQAVDPHFDPHLFQRFCNKKASKTEVFDAFWSWWCDSNTRPADYEVYRGAPFDGFQGFWSLSARYIAGGTSYPLHCFHPLVSLCGSRCGSKLLHLIKECRQNIKYVSFQKRTAVNLLKSQALIQRKVIGRKRV